MTELLTPVPAEMTAAEIAAACGADAPAQNVTVRGFSTDTRTIEPGSCFLALKGANFNGNLYAKQAAEKGAVLCILSEVPAEEIGVPYILTDDTAAAYAKIAQHWMMQRKQSGLRVVGITGSSGKTTVKDMTAHVLSHQFRTICTAGNFNNHIGVPRTVLGIPQEAEAAVVEMGMNHAGEISHLTKIARPDIALITNIGTAHIGNLGSQENICKAKLEILDGMDGGTLLVPADDPYLLGAQAEAAKRVTVRFSTRCGNPAAELTADDITETAENTRFTVHYAGESAAVLLPMTGLHNVSDALLAIHAGVTLGMPLSRCAAALADFTPGAMRSERVQLGSLTVIRDYYNANPEAMQAALRSLETIAAGRRRIAVLGNMNELGDYAPARHRELGALCREYADAAYFCGENYADFAAGYGSGETAFAAQADLIPVLLAALSADDTPACMLIKASRGLHMERVYEAIEAARKG